VKIAVTGATGFIGTALCPLLEQRGHRVIVLERNGTNDLQGADAVVHLAAIAHSRGVDEAKLRAVNVDASVALGRTAAAQGARMLFMSTVKVHGEESGDTPFCESAPLAPQDAYARAKAQAETELRSIPGLKLTVFRPPLVYGPGVKANFLALMHAVARGWPLPFASIANRRSLVYVGNLTHALASALESHRSQGKSYVVSDGAPVSTPQLCRAIAEALDRRARLFAFPPALLELVPPLRSLTRSLEVNDALLHSELGWSPPHSPESAMRRTTEWYRARGG